MGNQRKSIRNQRKSMGKHRNAPATELRERRTVLQAPREPTSCHENQPVSTRTNLFPREPTLHPREPTLLSENQLFSPRTNSSPRKHVSPREPTHFPENQLISPRTPFTPPHPPRQAGPPYIWIRPTIYVVRQYFRHLPHIVLYFQNCQKGPF